METITLARMTEIAVRLNGTYINVDGAFGNQCWDSQARIAQILGLPVVHTNGEGRWPGWAGNMWDAFPQTEAIAAAYVRVPASNPGAPGDIAIWGDSYAYYPKTHVATVMKDAGGLLMCLSQNSSAPRPDLPGYSIHSTGPTIIQHLPKNGLLGYLRPRTTTGLAAQGTIKEQDDDVALTDKQAKALDWLAENKERILQVTEALDERTGNSKTGTLKQAADLILRKINPTDWPDGNTMFIAAQADVPVTPFYRAKDGDGSIYELVGGALRGVTKAEWELRGETARYIDTTQAAIDTMPKVGA